MYNNPFEEQMWQSINAKADEERKEEEAYQQAYHDQIDHSITPYERETGNGHVKFLKTHETSN